MYASHAPFGGNVVGIRAAALKYFNRRPEQLSWAEAALLAVLPNAPALLYPGKNNTLLKQKRDGLLAKLYREGVMSEDSYHLALAEPLPEKSSISLLWHPICWLRLIGKKKEKCARHISTDACRKRSMRS